MSSISSVSASAATDPSATVKAQQQAYALQKAQLQTIQGASTPNQNKPVSGQSPDTVQLSQEALAQAYAQDSDATAKNQNSTIQTNSNQPSSNSNLYTSYGTYQNSASS